MITGFINLTFNEKLRQTKATQHIHILVTANTCLILIIYINDIMYISF